MKIYGKDKRINFTIYILVFISIIWTIISIYTIIGLVKRSTFDVIIVFYCLITAYVDIVSFYGLKNLKRIVIQLDDNKIQVTQYETINKRDIRTIIMYPYYVNRSNMKYPISWELNLKDIKKYGFVMDLNTKFKYSTKFNIGFIDKKDNKYIIILNQFNEDDVIEIIKRINSVTKIDPVGNLKNILK